MNLKKSAVLALLVSVIALVVILAHSPTSRAAGPICSVPGSYATIQGAVNDVGCTTINVAAGNYNETIGVTRSVIINGAQSGNSNFTTRGANPAAESTVNGANVTASTGAFNVSASNVTINGFTIKHTVVSGAAMGIIVSATGDNAMIVNNIFDTITSPDTGTQGTAQAVYLFAGPDGVTIQNNEMKNVHSNRSAKGVLVGDNGGINSSINLTIKGNSVHNITSDTRGAYGVSVANVTPGTSGLQVVNNGFDTLTGGGWAHAIGLEGNTPGVVVAGNSISNIMDLTPTPNDAISVWFESNPSFATALVNNNNFNVGPTNFGIAVHPALSLAFPTSNVDGTCNWWGDASGPGGAGPGTGALVGPNVTFSPWQVFSGGPCSGPDTAAPTVLSVSAAPSQGTTGTTLTLTSNATDASGLKDIYYNLFTPGGAFVCNLAHVSISGGPLSYTDSGTVVGAAMPFAGLDTGVGGPCPASGIAEGSYVLAANWIDILGNQVGQPNNQDPNNYPASAKFSPVIYDITGPSVTPPPAVTLFTGAGATTCTVTVANLDGALGTATAIDNLTGVVSIVRTGVPAGNVFSGTTILTYTATDGVGNSAFATQTVTVIDNTPPVLTLNGANPLLVPYGTVFTDPGATATDNCAGNLTGSIVATGTVNTFALGNYTRTYTVSDGANTTVKTRTVKVVAHPVTNKDQCKDDGWKLFTRADGSTFKNQGDCIQYVNTGK